jgi:hypothetical protein
METNYHSLLIEFNFFVLYNFLAKDNPVEILNVALLGLVKYLARDIFDTPHSPRLSPAVVICTHDQP